MRAYDGERDTLENGKYMTNLKIRADFFEVVSIKWELALCKYIEDAVERGERIYIWAESSQLAEYLDDLLWTYNESSFIPHARWNDCDISEPVAIGTTPGNPNDAMRLVVAGRVDPEQLCTGIEDYSYLVDFVQKRDESLTMHARARWSALSKAGVSVEFNAEADG
ncbi:MAG: hypothetical protein C0608_00340 [Deltaproteobacteria bacterium]|nr:MAG: hypothetical protein C0608_00340 [Deltaproteobacteria bacterium]